LRQHWEIYVLALSGTLGSVLFPGWLFQGLERMATFAMLLLGLRAASLAGIFLLVRSANDVGTAILLQSLAGVVAGMVALYVSWQWTEGKFERPSIASIGFQLREAWGVFISSLAINLYTTAQTVIVGSVGGPLAAGYYGASDKCLSAAKAGFGVLAQAAMPRVAYLATHDADAGLLFIRRLLLTAPIGLAASMVMYLFADQIVALLFGASFVRNVVPLFKILSPIPCILNISACFATLFMFNYGFRRQWSQMIIAACCVSLLTLAVLHFLVPIEIAAATSSLVTETFVLVVSAFFFFRAGSRRNSHVH